MGEAMKHSVVMLALMAICCLGAQSSHAMPGLTKTCPECRGLGRFENWYGGLSPCENCGGDGKVCNWFGVITIAALAIATWGKSRK